MAKKVVDAVKAKFGDAVVATSTEHGDEVITVKRDKLLAIAAFLKDDPAMSFDRCRCSSPRSISPRLAAARPPGAPDEGTRPAYDAEASDGRASRSATSCARSSTATASG
jgi:hypothetical protein